MQYGHKSNQRPPPLTPSRRRRRAAPRRGFPALRKPRRWLERGAAGGFFTPSRRPRCCGGRRAQRRKACQRGLCATPSGARLCVQSGVGGGADHRATHRFRPADGRSDQGRTIALGARRRRDHLHAPEYKSVAHIAQSHQSGDHAGRSHDGGDAVRLVRRAHQRRRRCPRAVGVVFRRCPTA